MEVERPILYGEERNLLPLALGSYDRPQDKGDPTWRQRGVAVIEHRSALWIVFQLALAALKCSVVSSVQASGFEREGRLHICPVVCRQFWTELPRLVGDQSIPIEVMMVASQDEIPIEMTGCRAVSCSRFASQSGLETLEVMEAKLFLWCRKRYVQIRSSSDCRCGHSLSLRLLELESASEG